MATKVDTGIWERQPGVFDVRVHVGRDPATGRIKQVTRTTRSGISAARRLRAKLTTEVAEGKHGGKTGTVESLLAEWIALAERQGRSPATVAGYRSKCRRLVAGLGAVRLDKLKAQDVDRLYARMSAEGMTAGNIRAHHRVLAAALHQAEKWDWVTRNAASLSSPPQVAEPPRPAPDPDRVRRIITEADRARSRALGTAVLLAATTGMRRGELCGLRWSDVDWAGQTIHVARAIWQTKEGWGTKTPKSRQARRISFDAEVTLEALNRRLAYVIDQAELAGVDLSVEAYVLSRDVDGSTPMLPSALTQAYERAVDRCAGTVAKRGEPKPKKSARELGWPRFHDLRHFAASQMIGAGVDPSTVAARLGHANSAVTLKVYSHALEQQDREAAKILGELVAPRP